MSIRRKGPIKPEMHGQPPGRSNRASQFLSEGPLIGKAIHLFLRFFWQITPLWTHANFIDRKQTQLASSLANRVVDQIADPQDKTVSQKYFECHFKALLH